MIMIFGTLVLNDYISSFVVVVVVVVVVAFFFHFFEILIFQTVGGVKRQKLAQNEK